MNELEPQRVGVSQKNHGQDYHEPESCGPVAQRSAGKLRTRHRGCAYRVFVFRLQPSPLVREFVIARANALCHARYHCNAAFSATRPVRFVLKSSQSVQFREKSWFFAGQFVALSCVFIHIPGGSFIFNISWGDFRSAVVREGDFRTTHASPGLHHTSKLHYWRRFVKRHVVANVPGSSLSWCFGVLVAHFFHHLMGCVASKGTCSAVL